MLVEAFPVITEQPMDVILYIIIVPLRINAKPKTYSMHLSRPLAEREWECMLRYTDNYMYIREF